MAMFALPEALFLVLNPARGANAEGGPNKITGYGSRGPKANPWPR
jgi:hypothetical protein